MSDAPIRSDPTVDVAPRRPGPARGDAPSAPSSDGRERIGPAARTRRAGIVLPAAVAVALILAVAAAVYWQANAGLVKTDNAQTAGDVAPISARIAGTVIKVDVTDNQHVTAGTVLVELDSEDYKVALRRAQADLAGARAQVSAAEAALAAQQQQFTTGVSIARAALDAARPRLPQAQAQLAMQEGMTEAQIAQAREQVTTARADVQAAQSNLETARRTLDRDRQLVAQGAISAQQTDVDNAAYEAARARYQSAQDALRQAEAGLAAARASRQQVAMAASGVASNTAQVAQVQAQLQQAQSGAAVVQQRAQEVAMARAREAAAAEAVVAADLNLSRTLIRAPADGWVTNRTVQIGQVVQPNQPLLSLTLVRHVWVVANVKETQVGRIRAGDPVRITVDAFRGRTLRGHVESIGSATGSSTALLPPDNATGNFVKVVQLVPVRIALDADADPQIQVGLSAEVAIDTRHHPR